MKATTWRGCPVVDRLYRNVPKMTDIISISLGDQRKRRRADLCPIPGGYERKRKIAGVRMLQSKLAA
jgi:hypothetical protein